MKRRDAEFCRFIQELLGRYGGEKVLEVVVEAGHIYTNEQPGPEHHQSLELGAELCQRLIRAGIRPVPVIFIDDYNPTETTLCQRTYLASARGLGFDPAEVIMESEFVAGAEKIIELLNMVGQIDHNDGVVFTVSPKVCLQKADGKLSCAALDAAFYRYKFHKWPFAITVLPSDYKDQQRNTKRLLKLLGHKTLPMANVFFRRDGQLTFSFPA
ncbi:MAG: hypothetical protein WCW26_05540 [Candidatus Buchananbacteria bacterium]